VITEVVRYNTTKTSTIGVLIVNGIFRCHTLELASVWPKVPGKSRIPSGLYRLDLRTYGSMHEDYLSKYPFHRGMLHLVNVQDFTDVFFHVGNYPRNTLGCILMASVNDIDRPDYIGRSVDAYEKIYPEIAEAILREPTFVSIKDMG